MLSEDDRLKRWRLILGEPASESLGFGPGGHKLDGTMSGMDRSLGALYDSERKGGLGASSPNISRWLGDIRSYFPSSVVRVMQKDAMDRLGLNQMLQEPELLEQLEPDVHLVSTLLTLNKVMPNKTRHSARIVVRKLVDDLMRRIREPMRQAVAGAISRSVRTRRPRPNAIDWPRTIRKNLRHWLPEHRTLVPELLVGHGRKQNSLRHVILCVDQSGSMAASVVYSSIFAAVMASLPAVKTKMVVFDTAVVDLTENLRDPVDLLFGTQLGGGTDINLALGYCETIVEQPSKTILVLITDLYEGGDAGQMLARAARLKTAGVNVVCLLALSDDGAPGFDSSNASALAALGIPSFACTPDHFPDLMATCIRNSDIAEWAARHNIVTAGRQRK